MKKSRRSLAFHCFCRIGTILFLAATAISAFAASGDLDPTFGNGGRVFTEIPRPAGYELFYPNAESIVVQPDGKILISGRFWEDVVSYWYGTFIVRYMPDGTLDRSFGTNGMVAVIDSHYPYGGRAVGAAMALQPDGKIVLIGQVTIAEGLIVQRYTSTGQVDTTFGDNGITIVQGKAFAEGTSIAIQPDGKIVGVGWEYDLITPYYDAILVFRLNTNGSPDATFGPARGGKLFIDNGYDGPTVLIQPDAKTVVVGTLANNARQVPPTLLVVRYNTDGSLDSSFGTGGRVEYTKNPVNFLVSSAALQADGKIVVAVEHPDGLVRFNSDGILDTSFGTNGIAPLESTFYEPVVLVQNDGNIIVTGNVPNATTGRFDFAILRFYPNGFPDIRFGASGRAVFPISAGGTNYAFTSAAALQPDGKVLVTGYFGDYYTDSHEQIAIIRVLSDGSRRRAVRK
jgi:uncharacterized delta-60 repeat protein